VVTLTLTRTPTPTPTPTLTLTLTLTRDFKSAEQSEQKNVFQVERLMRYLANVAVNGAHRLTLTLNTNPYPNPNLKP